MKKILLICLLSLLTMSAYARVTLYGGISTDTDFDPLDNFVVGGNYFFNPASDFSFGIDVNYTLLSGLPEGVTVHPISGLLIGRIGKSFFGQFGAGATYMSTSIDILGVTETDSDTSLGFMAGAGMYFSDNFLFEARALIDDEFDFDTMSILALLGFRF